MNNLSDWLTLLENRHTTQIQLGLERVRIVASQLKLLEPEPIVITVAGTNGKGSTIAALEKIYTSAGYQTGAYSSPHLFCFNERIRMNHQFISDDSLINYFSIIEQARGDIPLTYFEVATLAALLHFQSSALDIILLEVGLGGRLDATNIIDADLAIITSVDFDHQEYLGHTLDDIGREKAGILRPEQIFISAASEIPQSALTKAAELSTHTYLNNRDYEYHLDDEYIHLFWKDKSIKLAKNNFPPDSICAAVIASLLLTDKLPLPAIDYYQTLQYLALPGRLQHHTYAGKKIIFDVAHNPQSARRLADHIRAHKPGGKIYSVFSALADKDVVGIISPFFDLIYCWYPVKLENKRACSLADLKNYLLKNNCLYDDACSEAVLAFEKACQEASADDLIVVYGSFVVVGAVLTAILNHSPIRSYYEISNG